MVMDGLLYTDQVPYVIENEEYDMILYLYERLRLGAELKGYLVDNDDDVKLKQGTREQGHTGQRQRVEIGEI